MPDPVIFWDIDGTIISSSMESRLFNFLLKKKYISGWKVLFNLIRLSLRFPFPKWYRIKMYYLKGKSESEVRVWLDEAWSKIFQPNIYTGSYRAIKKFREENIRQVLVSGTIMPLAEKMAEHLKLADCIAAEPVIINGFYTEAVTKQHPYGIYKAEYAEDWLRQNGYSWDKCIAIADHFNDRFLLDKVAAAIVVNPSEKMKKLAKQKGWPSASTTDENQLYEIIKEALAKL